MMSSTVIEAANNLRIQTYVWVHSGCRFNTSTHPSRCLFNSRQAKKYIVKQKPFAIIVSESLPAGESVQTLVDSIMKLEKFSHKIIVISPIPVIADENFNRKGSLIFPSPDYPKAISRRNLDAQSEKKRKLFLMELHMRNINVVDPYSYLCNPKSCLLERDGMHLYRDNNHLTPAGARILLNAITQAINSK